MPDIPDLLVPYTNINKEEYSLKRLTDFYSIFVFVSVWNIKSCTFINDEIFNVSIFLSKIAKSYYCLNGRIFIILRQGLIIILLKKIICVFWRSLYLWIFSWMYNTHVQYELSTLKGTSLPFWRGGLTVLESWIEKKIMNWE